MSDAKMTTLLRQTLERATADPDRPLDLVVTPAEPAAAEPLGRHIEALGGQAVRQQPEGIECRLPARQVKQLAESPLVSSVRPARVHRMF
jgi:hypothetical protein